MSDRNGVYVGLAGWANPPDTREVRGKGQSHLSYYAQHFSCVEINSSFYRPHLRTTYARWRDETPAEFLFSVKMPRSITHDGRLRRSRAEVGRFYEAVTELQPKLAAVLVQLPPSLEYSGQVVRAFFRGLPHLSRTRIACEPRHASWFTKKAEDALTQAGVSRVAADPARFDGSGVVGGSRRLAYFRWHGSPRMYYSGYSEKRLGEFAGQVGSASTKITWCVFDNTARHAAWSDALRFKRLIK